MKTKKSKTRYKITLENGKEYFVYASSPNEAYRVCLCSRLFVGEQFIVGEDNGPWKTTLFEGRHAPGA